MRVAPPNVVGAVPLPDGRKLGFAEFGDPAGEPVLWFHGTPGSCRQVAPAAKVAASESGVRIIGVSRPGAGVSTPHRYGAVVDWVPDIAVVADRLGLERFAVVGLSGGGPFTLATAHGLGDRVVGACVLGGVAPTVGAEAADGGLPALAARLERLSSTIAHPVGGVLAAVLRPLTPAADQIYAAFASRMPPGDQRVFAQPGVKDMFIDDLSRSIRTAGLAAAMQDLVLFGRHWGFDLADVVAPVHWWHGDEDSIVPQAHGEHVVSLLPNGRFIPRPGDSHLSGYAAADDVIDTVRRFF